jgi:hypothetical protein
VRDAKGLTLRERFDAKGFGVVKYARAHKLSRPILSNVLSEKEDAKGVNRSRKGATRLVYKQLKKDGIYMGALPWEVKR